MEGELRLVHKVAENVADGPSIIPVAATTMLQWQREAGAYMEPEVFRPALHWTMSGRSTEAGLENRRLLSGRLYTAASPTRKPSCRPGRKPERWVTFDMVADMTMKFRLTLGTTGLKAVLVLPKSMLKYWESRCQGMFDVPIAKRAQPVRLGIPSCMVPGMIAVDNWHEIKSVGNKHNSCQDGVARTRASHLGNVE